MNEKMYYYLLENKLLTHGIGDINDKETYFKRKQAISSTSILFILFFQI